MLLGSWFVPFVGRVLHCIRLKSSSTQFVFLRELKVKVKVKEGGVGS